MHEFARRDTAPHRAESHDADDPYSQRARHTLANHFDQVAAACRTAPHGRHVVAWLHGDGTWGGVSTPTVLHGISRVTVPKGAFVIYLAADLHATPASVSDQFAARRLQPLAALATTSVTS